MTNLDLGKNVYIDLKDQANVYRRTKTRNSVNLQIQDKKYTAQIKIAAAVLNEQQVIKP